MSPCLSRLSGPAFCALLLAVHGPAAAAEALALDVAPAKFAEHCLRLDAGEAIRWRFTATAPMDFNIHYHRGEAVLQPVRREAAGRGSGAFRARSADVYCLMWTNRGAGAGRVRGSVERQR
jgi:hypothetical protein